VNEQAREQPGPRNVRYDAELADLDIPDGITRGLSMGGAAQRSLFAEVAIAASHRAEEIGVDPLGLAFLARHVRSAGVGRAAELPEPLVGPAGTALAREWLAAARPVAGDVVTDDLFSRWLAAVAMLLASRLRLYRGGAR
jgi:hypothetical protein